MLFDIVIKIYDDFCSLCSGVFKLLIGKNKNRSRFWMKVLFEL